MAARVRGDDLGVMQGLSSFFPTAAISPHKHAAITAERET